MTADYADILEQNVSMIEKLDFIFSKGKLSLEYGGTITLPFILCLYSFLTGIQIWPFLRVLKLSDRHSLFALITASAFSRIFLSFRSISSLNDFKSFDALSSILPFLICRPIVS